MPQIFGNNIPKHLLCTRFERETPLEEVLKKFWKKIPDFLEIPKFALPLHPLRWRRLPSKRSEKGSEKFSKKIFRKDLAVSKKVFTFAPLSAMKKNGGRNRGDGASRTSGQNEKLFFIVIYRAAFFEVFEQLLVFLTLFGEWFQTIPLRLERKI